MKNVLIILTVVYFVISCSDENVIAENETILSAENLASDAEFVSFVSDQGTFTDIFRQKMDEIPKDQIEAYMVELTRLEEESAEDENIEQISDLMGFSSVNEYLELNEKLIASSQLLIERYPVLALGEIHDQNFGVVKKAIAISNYNIRARRSTINSCESEYNDCQDGADANLLLTMVGCVGTIAIPVIGPALGVACTVAAARVHFVNSTQCNNNYNGCAIT
jgi:hypothetical protein